MVAQREEYMLRRLYCAAGGQEHTNSGTDDRTARELKLRWRTESLAYRDGWFASEIEDG